MTPETLRALRIAATCNAHGLTQAEALTIIDEVERLQEQVEKLREMLIHAKTCELEDDERAEIDALLMDTEP